MLVLTIQIPLSQADEAWFTGVCHSNRFDVSVSLLTGYRIGDRDSSDDVCNKHDDQRFLAWPFELPQVALKSKSSCIANEADMFEASSCSASSRSVDITMNILKSVLVTQFLGKLQTLSALKTDEEPA
ncbi:hypothetical protein [Novipirellula rosea]|uniref:hypothetical protein n=1 Tax=Novipirellula rosea TaxID=1031540 RepID=UPI0031F16F64